MKKALVALSAAGLLVPQANAAQYTLDSWSTANIIAAPFSHNEGAGLLSGDTRLTGYISLSSDTFLGIEYSAYWDIDLISATITATDVSCARSTSAIAAGASGSSCSRDGVDFFAEGSTTAIRISVDQLNRQTLLSWQTTDSLFSQYDFRVSQVPVPAAAWLFSSALLGLVGLKRQ
ncbi:hypothetical protein [Oceanicoccus sagamiensis]|uniref:PEP-CTERM protein-sorting domain-containing protein n=1 Tax=Oceanicoccus sagamiensis TaxID=716816 RepID=A0A1X9NAT9_9GAMM|nr:hypothetical protein [Oceanicoccus sagamiensis]ARN74271.1 hypothetical protein BST96_09140 [Oceanicoccus sagamiensis]